MIVEEAKRRCEALDASRALGAEDGGVSEDARS